MTDLSNYFLLAVPVGAAAWRKELILHPQELIGPNGQTPNILKFSRVQRLAHQNIKYK